MQFSAEACSVTFPFFNPIIYVHNCFSNVFLLLMDFKLKNVSFKIIFGGWSIKYEFFVCADREQGPSSA